MPVTKRGTSRKGRALQLLARDLWEALGANVAIAQPQVLWIPDDTKPLVFDRKTGQRRKQLRPITKSHDLFGCWDLAYVIALPYVVGVASERSRISGYVQVTTWDGVRGRRAKIEASGFPATSDDYIMGHIKGNTWRVVRWPAAATALSERWTLKGDGSVEKETWIGSDG